MGVGSIRCCLCLDQVGWWFLVCSRNGRGELLSASEGTACVCPESSCCQVLSPPQVPQVPDHLPGSRAVLGPAGRCRMLWCKHIRMKRQL